MFSRLFSVFSRLKGTQWYCLFVSALFGFCSIVLLIQKTWMLVAGSVSLTVVLRVVTALVVCALEGLGSIVLLGIMLLLGSACCHLYNQRKTSEKIKATTGPAKLGEQSVTRTAPAHGTRVIQGNKCNWLGIICHLPREVGFNTQKVSFLLLAPFFN